MDWSKDIRGDDEKALGSVRLYICGVFVHGVCWVWIRLLVFAGGGWVLLSMWCISLVEISRLDLQSPAFTQAVSSILGRNLFRVQAFRKSVCVRIIIWSHD